MHTDLANTLQLISDDGPSVFYEGAMAEAIVSDYRGYTINGMPPPSSGEVNVAHILECIEPLDIGDEDAGFGFGSTETLNVMIESMRLAFSSRSV